MCGVLLIYSKKKLIRSNCLKTFKSIYNRGPDKQLNEKTKIKKFISKHFFVKLKNFKI
jgi:hypothetical protein